MQSGTPNLSCLRAFEAAARTESFSRAAKELGLTPAAISRSVRRLEGELGFALFHRTHRAVSLTDAGARYAQKVTEGFRQLSIHDAGGPASRPRLTLDVEATFLRQWLLPRFGTHSFKALELSVTVRVHHDPPRVIPANADLAIVWGFANYSGFKRQRLVTPRVLLVAAPSLKVTSLSEVAAKGLIHETNDHWWRLVYHEAGEPYPEHAAWITLARCDLPVEAARLGLGVAVADDVIAEQELRQGTLLPVDGPQLDSHDYYLMTRRGTSAQTSAFVSWLKQQAEAFRAWQEAR